MTVHLMLLKDTLDLIEKKPMCILTLLDEESTFPKATKETFANKLYAKLTQHQRFEKPRFSNLAFTISHYAGKVTYDTEGFLEKNKASYIGVSAKETLLNFCSPLSFSCNRTSLSPSNSHCYRRAISRS